MSSLGNRKRSYGAYKGGKAAIYSGKKRYVARLPKGFKTMGPLARRTGGWSNPTGGGELKFKDTGTTTNLTAGAVNWSPMGASLLLNGLVPDSTASGRIGRKVTLRSVYVRGSCSMNTTSTGGSPWRILIFYDKQSNATQPAITDVLLTDDHNSQNNLSNRDRFVTVADVMTPTTSAGGDYSTTFVIYKKLNLDVAFNAGAAGTIGDITSGSLYIQFSQNGNILTANPFVKWTARVRYTDV